MPSPRLTPNPDSQRLLVLMEDCAPRAVAVAEATGLGWDVRAAEGDMADFALSKYRPDLVLVQVELPGSDGLDLLREIRQMAAPPMVVALSFLDDLSVEVEALRMGAMDFLRGEAAIRDSLRRLLNKQIIVLQQQRRIERVSECLLRSERTLALPPSIEQINVAAEMLASHIRDAQTAFGVRLGLNELLMNALEHGNLGITNDEKAAALAISSETMLDLIAERLRNPLLAARRILVTATETPDYHEWMIADEGAGFDVSRLADPTTSDNVERLGGRGVFIARLQFDELEYLGRGNRVRARVNKRSAPVRPVVDPSSDPPAR